MPDASNVASETTRVGLQLSAPSLLLVARRGPRGPREKETGRKSMPRRGAAVPHIATVSVCAERRNGRRERELELSHSRVE